LLRRYSPRDDASASCSGPWGVGNPDSVYRQITDFHDKVGGFNHLSMIGRSGFRIPIAIASSTPKDISRRAFWLAETVTPFSALVRFGLPPPL
jgi:hypothetical protein